MFGITRAGQIIVPGPPLSPPPPAGAPLDKCWAEVYLPNGRASGEPCNHIVTTCRIGLCDKDCAALCGKGTA